MNNLRYHQTFHQFRAWEMARNFLHFFWSGFFFVLFHRRTYFACQRRNGRLYPKACWMFSSLFPPSFWIKDDRNIGNILIKNVWRIFCGIFLFSSFGKKNKQPTNLKRNIRFTGNCSKIYDFHHKPEVILKVLTIFKRNAKLSTVYGCYFWFFV